MGGRFLGTWALFVLTGTLPAAAETPLSLYGKLPTFEMAAISPAGNRIAILGAANGVRSLIIIDDKKKPLKRFAIGDSKVRGIQWVGEDQVLIRITETVRLGTQFTAEKAEMEGALVMPVRHGPPWWIFGSFRKTIAGGVRSFNGIAQRDGGWFGYFGGITLGRSLRGQASHFEDGRPELYQVDFATQAVKRLGIRPEREFLSRQWLLDGTGTIAMTFEYDHQSGDWQITNAGGKQVASGKDLLGNAGMVGFGHDGSTLIYREVDESGAVHWREVSLTGGAWAPVLDGIGIREIYFDDESNRLLGYLADGNDAVTKFFDPHHDQVANSVRRAFPNLNVRFVDWNRAFDKLIVKTDGPGDPNTFWLVNAQSGKAEPLGSAYIMEDIEVGPMRMIRYKAADGLEMEGVLTLPPGREPKMLPVILLPHGGPASRDYAGFDWWAQALASRGYAVFQPNFRGSTGYGTAFERAGRGEWGKKMQTDISDGLAELARQKIVDPSRACIVGASYGGYAALAGVTLQQGLYRCAVSVAGVADARRLMIDDVRESGQNPTMIRILKDQFGSGRDAGEISPVRFADRADAPILLIHGKDDIVVPYVQSELMANALKRANKPVEMVTLAGEDHWLSRSETRLTMLEAAVRFVEEHNPPR